MADGNERQAATATASGAGEVPSHYDTTKSSKFRNPWDSWQELTWARKAKYFATKNTPSAPSVAEMDKMLPVEKPDPSVLKSPPADGIVSVWLGHASFLIQIGGLNVLTDPVFSRRCSPVSFVGPERIRDVPLSYDELPHIDVIVLSHNHFDHLDLTTLGELNRLFKPTFLLPLGVSGTLKSLQCKCIDMDWWGATTITSQRTGAIVEFTLAPAQHWSTRGVPFDYCQSLWGGWTGRVVSQGTRPSIDATHDGRVCDVSIARTSSGDDTKEDPSSAARDKDGGIPAADAGGSGATTSTAAGGVGRERSSSSSIGGGSTAQTPSFFFSGDTGYCPAFKEIGQRLGPFDLAILPLGAYCPRDFMRPQHCDPAESVIIHREIKSRFSIGMHWGTFILSNEPVFDPPHRLLLELDAAQVPREEFVCVRIGAAIVIRGVEQGGSGKHAQAPAEGYWKRDFAWADPSMAPPMTTPTLA